MYSIFPFSGIQQYLFESGRIDNLFGDSYYERFTEQLNEILTKYTPLLNQAGIPTFYL